jgi:hypothetical protein
MVLPPFSNVHGTINCASLALAIAARAVATFLSNVPEARPANPPSWADREARRAGQNRTILFREWSAPRPGSSAMMRGQAAHGHGFFVRLPAELVFGHALQRFAGVGHFMIEFG